MKGNFHPFPEIFQEEIALFLILGPLAALHVT